MSITRKIIGEPIGVTGLGLDYSPINELGVIFLFAKCCEHLGIEALQRIQAGFPDAIGRKKIDKGKFTEVSIEFEYKSSGFKEHIKKRQYNGANCDIVVCWEHDWKEIPKELEIIELKSVIPDLFRRGKLPPKIRKLSPREKEYLEFFEDLLNRIKIRLPSVTQKKPSPQPWCSIPIGMSGFHLEWQICKRPRPAFLVSLDMERPKKEENEKLFRYLKKQEDDLKRELGKDLQFQYPWGNKWARIYKKKNYDPNNKKEVEEVKNWGVEMMIKFYKSLKSRIDKYLLEYKFEKV